MCGLHGPITAVNVADEDEQQVDALKDELLLACSRLDARSVKVHAQALELQRLQVLVTPCCARACC